MDEKDSSNQLYEGGSKIVSIDFPPQVEQNYSIASSATQLPDPTSTRGPTTTIRKKYREDPNTGSLITLKQQKKHLQTTGSSASMDLFGMDSSESCQS